jgi:hypothetical protein
MIPPYHIYAMRRYLPIVIPTLILFSALALLYIWRSKRYPWNKSVAVLLFLSLAGGLLYQSRNIFYHRDYPEMVQQINALNQKVRPGALLIIAESDEHIFGDKIGPPLHFIFDHPVATIRRDGPRIDAFLQSLNQLAQTQNRPVQLLAYEPLAGGIADHLDLKPVFMYPLRLSSLQNTYYNYPGAVEKEVLPIELYDAELFSSQKFPSAQKVTIDLGAFDAPYIRHGFYGKESIPGFPSLRWTKEQAGLYIPLRRTGGDHLLISIRAATFRPRKLEAAPVTVILAGETVGTFIPDEQWRTFTFQTRPPASGENTLLEFKTGSFNPARLRINADGRDLGFLLDWITLERTKP